MSERWFVCGKDMASGAVFVAPGTHHPALYTDSLRVARQAFNWIGPVPPEVRKLIHPSVHPDHSGPESISAPPTRHLLLLHTTKINPQIETGVPFPCLYRVRYRQPLAPCTVAPDPDDPAAFLRVAFGSPQRAVAVQQTLALYCGPRCLGGGAIAAPGPSYWEMGKPLPEDCVDWAVS